LMCPSAWEGYNSPCWNYPAHESRGLAKYH
jgi:hypothetical protein